jgi:hypothetical protein
MDMKIEKCIIFLYKNIIFIEIELVPSPTYHLKNKYQNKKIFEKHELPSFLPYLAY